MLIRRTTAYSSSCSQVVLVSVHLFCRSSLFCSRKSQKFTKNPCFEGSRSFKVIDVDTTKKHVTSACCDKQHVYASVFTLGKPLAKNNHFYGVPVFDIRVRRPR